MMRSKSRYELERDYSSLRNSWNNIIDANVRLVDDNKRLKIENRKILDNIELIYSMFKDPENHFEDGCYCRVIEKIIEECKYGNTSI